MTDTLIRQRGVRLRMQCSGQVATIIANTFTTAEDLIAAVESDLPLVEHNGIGPKTAETIMEWWVERESREKQMPGSTVEHTSARSANVHLHNAWWDALGVEPPTDDEKEDDDDWF